MKAYIEPARLKHYGTDIKIIHPTGRELTINVWCPIGAPSQQELDDYGISVEEWENNIEVPDGWGGVEPVQDLFPCDTHYQSKFEADLVDVLVAAINAWENT